MKNNALIYENFGDPRSTIKLVHTHIAPVPPNLLRVRVLLSSINPSDLIPITGSYSHRIKLPLVAGYEGVGEVISAPEQYRNLVGTRVLPLRSGGTWQNYIDCSPSWVISVPDFITNEVACKAYINPLTAYSMLKKWDPQGKIILLTGGGTECAQIIGQWALEMGARKVISVYRSIVHCDILERLGFIPISENSILDIIRLLKKTDIVFDSIGGNIGSIIINNMRLDSIFVTYGLLSGMPLTINRERYRMVKNFHLKDVIKTLDQYQWKDIFYNLWPRLVETELHTLKHFRLNDWENALEYYSSSGRQTKLAFDLT